MSKISYLLICIPSDDSEPIYEVFHRKYEAKCCFNLLSQEKEFSGAYIQKLETKTIKVSESIETINLMKESFKL